MILQFLHVVWPIFAIAGLGWTWRRLGQPFDEKSISALVTYLGGLTVPLMLLLLGGSLTTLKLYGLGRPAWASHPAWRSPGDWASAHCRPKR